MEKYVKIRLNLYGENIKSECRCFTYSLKICLLRTYYESGTSVKQDR